MVFYYRSVLSLLKKLDGATKSPRKSKVIFLCNWRKFHEKAQLYPEKPYFFQKRVFFVKNFPKKCVLSAKISDDLFSVINSDFHIFTLFCQKLHVNLRFPP